MDARLLGFMSGTSFGVPTGVDLLCAFEKLVPDGFGLGGCFG